MKRTGFFAALFFLMAVQPVQAATEAEMRAFYKEYGTLLQGVEQKSQNAAAINQFINRYYAPEWKSTLSMKIDAPGGTKMTRTTLTRAQLQNALPAYGPAGSAIGAGYSKSLKLTSVDNNAIRTRTTVKDANSTTVIDCVHIFSNTSPPVVKSEKCTGTAKASKKQ